MTRHDAYWAYAFSERSEGRGPRPSFTVVHESSDGQVDGFARYRIREDWSGGIASHTLEVFDLYALDDEVEARLWQFVVEVDLVAYVKGLGRPLDDPIRFRLTDPRRVRITEVTDHLWVRVVDPASSLAARRYRVEDRLVIELADPFLPANAGRWLVEGGPDGADAHRTTAPPDLVMSAPELGALYLGGVSAAALARAGGLTELTAGAVERADWFFGTTPLPWCRTDF